MTETEATFSSFHDLHGHATGDAVLAPAAQRLRTRLSDLGVHALVLARLGGDEFAALLVLPGGGASAGAGRAAAAVHQALCCPYPGACADAPCGAVFVGASIGVALGPPGTPLDWGPLIEACDTALYVAKRRGGGLSGAYPRVSSSRCRTAPSGPPAPQGRTEPPELCAGVTRRGRSRVPAPGPGGLGASLGARSGWFAVSVPWVRTAGHGTASRCSVEGASWRDNRLAPGSGSEDRVA